MESAKHRSCKQDRLPLRLCVLATELAHKVDRGRSTPPQQNIVRVNEDSADRVRYGLASFRWFHTPSFLFDDSDDESDASKADVGLAK
jgi:hypothetical protein